MDAIVLVGGEGTRLRPLTWTRHKSLVPVCNRPAISYLLDWLRRSGVERAALALGLHNEDLATAYPPGAYDGLELTVVTERERLESGGAIRNAVREAGIKGRFVVLNGDVFVDFDFAEAVEAHEAARADLTLALYAVDDPSSFGVAAVDETGLVTGFVEKPPLGTEPSNLVNAGVWIFEPGLVDEIPSGAVRVEDTLFPSLVARRRRVLGHRFVGIWADIGSPARYLELNKAILARTGAAAIAPRGEVAPDARVTLSALGEGCQIGSRATVEDSILWERVDVGEGARVLRSILADGVHVGSGATVEGVTAGSGAVIGPGSVVPPGTLIEPHARYDASL